MFRDMNKAIALHRLKPVVDRVFGFEEASEALAYLESGKHFGKVVVTTTERAWGVRSPGYPTGRAR